MAEELEQSQELTPPTDEQAMAFLNGNSGAAVEQSKPATTAPTAPEVSQASIAPLDTATIQQMLKEALNPIQSELGQLRKIRSEFDRSKQEANKPTTPQSWSSMTPEQQAELQELVDHAWQQKYGKDWNEFQSDREQQRAFQQINSVEQLARQFAGENFKELDPIMGKMYSELKAKADQGDQEAAQIVHEVKTTRSGVNYLVQLAKQEMAKEIEAKGEQAKATQANTAKKVGVTLGSSSPAAEPQSPLNNLSNDPSKAGEEAAMLRKELVRRGAL